MNQNNGKNSLGLDSCFEDLDNPIELFKNWFSKAEKKEINIIKKILIILFIFFFNFINSYNYYNTHNISKQINPFKTSIWNYNVKKL